MSEARREKLLDIQRREQLKGMLVNKFKLKYGNKGNIDKYIDNEVTRFLANDRLTEDNLRKLDDKIMREADTRDKKEAILDDKRSGVDVASRAGGSRAGGSRASRRPGANDDAVSQRSVASSRMSGASRLSKKSEAVQQRQPDHLSIKGSQFDQMSMASSKVAKTEQYSEIDEDDEWNAIQKFNTLLHYEEQK